jgi:hypothetical protein
MAMEKGLISEEMPLLEKPFRREALTDAVRSAFDGDGAGTDSTG